ncbi:hypothetical protein [Rheinheimera baltica]|uniref:hypothetical protein n=1 Tax=Rheinheimera baltica TaxID=67576 RepID=UPI00273F91D7|nr:hypothetical protein [Rheinheimera baltica]MDP5190049.1 hypothetical protein [Rheinheimera baltica]
MGNAEIIVGIIMCAALIIWGSGLRRGAISILLISLALVLYGASQLIWPEAGKSIFLAFLVIAVILSFLFKEKVNRFFLIKKNKNINYLKNKGNK